MKYHFTLKLNDPAFALLCVHLAIHRLDSFRAPMDGRPLTSSLIFPTIGAIHNTNAYIPFCLTILPPSAPRTSALFGKAFRESNINFMRNRTTRFRGERD